MSTFDFCLLLVGAFVFSTWAFRKYAEHADERFLKSVYEPKRSWLKVWICKLQKHRKHGHYHIETNNGAHKIRCMGCDTVFLEGRKIKVVGLPFAARLEKNSKTC